MTFGRLLSSVTVVLAGVAIAIIVIVSAFLPFEIKRSAAGGDYEDNHANNPPAPESRRLVTSARRVTIESE